MANMLSWRKYDHGSLWDSVGRNIVLGPMLSLTIWDMVIELFEEWNKIPQSLIDQLVSIEKILGVQQY